MPWLANCSILAIAPVFFCFVIFMWYSSGSIKGMLDPSNTFEYRTSNGIVVCIPFLLIPSAAQYSSKDNPEN